MMQVRWLTSRSRTRCSACKSSYPRSSSPRNFIVGRCTASAIASASRKSFFLPLRIRSHVLRRHQPGIVPKAIELATEMMRTDAGLHADQARRHVGQPRLYLASRPLLPQHNSAAVIKADNVERVLADIDADHGDRAVGLL